MPQRSFGNNRHCLSQCSDSRLSHGFCSLGFQINISGEYLLKIGQKVMKTFYLFTLNFVKNASKGVSNCCPATNEKLI